MYGQQQFTIPEDDIGRAIASLAQNLGSVISQNDTDRQRKAQLALENARQATLDKQNAEGASLQHRLVKSELRAKYGDAPQEEGQYGPRLATPTSPMASIAPPAGTPPPFDLNAMATKLGGAMASGPRFEDRFAPPSAPAMAPEPIASGDGWVHQPGASDSDKHAAMVQQLAERLGKHLDPATSDLMGVVAALDPQGIGTVAAKMVEPKDPKLHFFDTNTGMVPIDERTIKAGQPVMGPDGKPLKPYVPPVRSTPTEIRAQALQRAQAAASVELRRSGPTIDPATGQFTPFDVQGFAKSLKAAHPDLAPEDAQVAAQGALKDYESELIRAATAGRSAVKDADANAGLFDRAKQVFTGKPTAQPATPIGNGAPALDPNAVIDALKKNKKDKF